MSIKLLLKAAVVVLCTSATPAFADGFTGSAKIIGYDVGDSSRLIFRTEAASGCGAGYMYVNRGDAWYSDMLAMVISAYNGGRTINVYVAQCESGGYLHAVRMVQGTVF